MPNLGEGLFVAYCGVCQYGIYRVVAGAFAFKTIYSNTQRAHQTIASNELTRLTGATPAINASGGMVTGSASVLAAMLNGISCIAGILVTFLSSSVYVPFTKSNTI